MTRMQPFARFAICVTTVCSLFLASGVGAAPTTRRQARRAVETWLALDTRPLGADLGEAMVGRVRAYPEAGAADYFVVELAPRGFVVLAGDDLVEPVVAFANDGTYDPSESNPLGALVSRDLAGRVRAARQLSEVQARSRAADKWARLLGRTTFGIPGPLSDERVTPFVQSKWSQETVGGNACYNYYTPPGSPGSSMNYPCGCVATAMAQLMRFLEYPTTSVGTKSFTIQVDGISQQRTLRGSDAWGGPYDYAKMPLQPDPSTGQAFREAIGALCHDAGVAIRSSYTADSTSASLADAADALLDTFHFVNVVFGYDSGNNIGSGLTGMVNPNLDAKLPVLLAIEGAAPGHAVVCDGYGYNFATPYHHLNFGWAGVDDAWYNLPDVDGTQADYSSIVQCAYNIFAGGTGEIVSGRVVDAGGSPIGGATVTGARPGGATVSGTTDSRGVYALVGASPASQYTVAAREPNHVFESRIATTGTSADYQNTAGNVWGVDFAAQADWTCSSDVPKAVPDASTGGVISTLDISAGGLITDADVALSVQHTRDSDLTAYLESPDGTSVTLFAGVGGNGDDFTNTILNDEAAEPINAGAAPFSGEYRPPVALSAFDGKPAAGTWKLKVVDGAAGIAGSLLSWCLRFTLAADTTPPTCAVTGPAGPTYTSPISFTIVFSEPVTGLTEADIAVTGGTGSLTGSGASYTFAVTPSGFGQVTCQVPAGAAQDASANANTASNVASVDYQNVGPAVAFASPTASASCGRTCATIDIAGTATDGGGVVSVSWSNDRGGSGACTGTSSWSATGIALQPGLNVITVTATDGVLNTGTATLTVTYSDLKPGGLWSGIALVSMPIIPDIADPKPNAGFDGNGWFAYDPVTSSYTGYPDLKTWFEPASSTPGRGFWAYFAAGGSPAAPCGTVPPQDQAATIHLEAGWNLIGAPFATPANWSLTGITVREAGRAPVALRDAYYLVTDYAWGWDSSKSAYYLVCDTSVTPSAKGTLDPWLGYWVKAKKACDLIIPAP